VNHVRALLEGPASLGNHITKEDRTPAPAEENAVLSWDTEDYSSGFARGVTMELGRRYFLHLAAGAATLLVFSGIGVLKTILRDPCASLLALPPEVHPTFSHA
jgi:hypothetical protein